MTERKPKNTTGILSEFQCAERICRIIAETNGTPLAEEVRLAIEKRRAERRAAANEQIAKLMARVPEGRRGHVAKHVVAAGYELGGFEIAAANETTRSDDVDADIVEGMGGDEELPAGARPIEPERAERIGRLTGGGRK